MPVSRSEVPSVAVVDDDENLRRSFARLLRAAGIHSITYSSAEAFLSDKTQPRVDCLVLDVQLPGMSGLELYEHLKADGNETDVLFITAYDEASVRDRAHSLGCAGYFRKSDPGTEVLNAIKRLIARGSHRP